MKASTINQIQKELATLEPKDVQALCMRLAKYKKDNKELLSYLLFDANDEKGYSESVKQEIDYLFSEMNRQSTYTTKKGLQKVVRNMNKFIRYSENKQTEIEIRIYFCLKVKAARINLDSSNVIGNLYYREKDKIDIAFSKLHEDLQFDYKEEMEKI